MAEFRYASTVEETVEILDSIFLRGDVYAIEETRSVPRPEDAECFRRPRKDHLERWNSRVFATLYLFGSYSSLPPEFWFFESRQLYHLASHGGGPYIEITFGPPIQGRVLFEDNSLSTESFYHVPESARVPGRAVSMTREQLAPMREAYKDFVKRAKRIPARQRREGEGGAGGAGPHPGPLPQAGEGAKRRPSERSFQPSTAPFVGRPGAIEPANPAAC